MLPQPNNMAEACQCVRALSCLMRQALGTVYCDNVFWTVFGPRVFAMARFCILHISSGEPVNVGHISPVFVSAAS